jgi:hypothetical protein
MDCFIKLYPRGGAHEAGHAAFLAANVPKSSINLTRAAIAMIDWEAKPA